MKRTHSTTSNGSTPTTPTPLPVRTPGATFAGDKPHATTLAPKQPERIDFPIHAHRCFSEAPTGGAA